MNSRPLSEVGHILICGGKTCKKDSKEFRKELVKAVGETQGRVAVVKTSCLGHCAKGPVIMVWPKGTCIQKAKKTDISQILAEAGWVAPAESNPEPADRPARKRTKKTGKPEKGKAVE